MILTALTNINAKIKAITKGQKNKDQGYQYRGIDDVMNELHQYFVEEKVLILPKFQKAYREERKSRNGGILIYTTVEYTYELVAVDGSRETITVQGEGMDSSDKSTNKAFSGSLKYALTTLFLIPTNETKDSEKESPEPLPRDDRTTKGRRKIQESRFNELIKACEKNPGKAYEYGQQARSVYTFTKEQDDQLSEWEDNSNQ